MKRLQEIEQMIVHLSNQHNAAQGAKQEVLNLLVLSDEQKPEAE